MTLLKNNEKIEDLQCDGLQIIQSSAEYRFTTDAVLLANFVADQSGKNCVEFGTGSGVVSILVAHKKHAKHVTAIEIQPQLADMARRSVALNSLDGVIDVVCDDLSNATHYVSGVADTVFCNPPYRRLGSGERQLLDNLAICRHEIATNLQQIILSASKVLNNRGNFYLVHQSCRLAEIISLCDKFGMPVKEILPVCPSPAKEPNLVLIRATKAGKQDCVLHSPLCVCDENGHYTERASIWYGTDGLRK